MTVSAKAKKKTVKEKTSPVLGKVESYSGFSDFDIHLFKEGKHFRLFEKMGAHVVDYRGVTGTYFGVWAPNAQWVSVVGNFNGWNKEEHKLFSRWDSSGIWEGFIPNIGRGESYKFCIYTKSGEYLEKADPFAFLCEQPPKTASIVWDTWYVWKDEKWMRERRHKNGLNKPFSVYEVHLASWKRNPEKPDAYLSYRELAVDLVKYVKEMGFTHVEFMPVMEFPFDGSWGYQITGYYASTSRFGAPQDLMYLIEALHAEGIGVILDWVPSHFPGDDHGLHQFDGTALYEHADPRLGFHPDWQSYIFNYGRNEVRSFLISNAIFWLDRFHVDGLRVDAVASMLYLDYSRKEGEWVPNQFGGRENLEAISLLKELNEQVYKFFPDTQTIAEESTAWAGVSRPTYTGGLGFGMKWMMGWMHDTLNYFSKDPFFRKFHQNELTFSTLYAFTENFMLPLSHDEVVHGKKALISKMPGDEWQRFANLRLLFGYMFTHPGTKLLFMGDEFGQTHEWQHNKSLAWELLQYAPHKGLQQLMKDLNKLYTTEAALFDKSFEGTGFEWIDANDYENSVIVFARKGNNPSDTLVIAMNMTPVPRNNYRIGITAAGTWIEVFNSNKLSYWGTGDYNNSKLKTDAISQHNKPQSLLVTLPPLGMIVLKQIK